MEPKHNNDYLPAVELPQLQDGAGRGAGPEQRAPAPETRGTQSPSAGSPVPVASALTGGSPVSDNPAGQAPTNPTTAMTAGLIADDADLIEKEWVLKAKAIVMQTKSDPRQQNIEMNNVKADYLKKRYNKDLKTSGS